MTQASKGRGQRRQRMNDEDFEKEFAGCDPEFAEAAIGLIKAGLVVDSGQRRNGQIVWMTAVPPKGRQN
jgi:hypothetical protein